MGSHQNVVPTVGFNVETIKYKNITFSIWDCGGQQRIRSLWKHYYESADALIYVVDSSDFSRLDESKNEFLNIINNLGSRNCLITILANKLDKQNTATLKQIMEKFELKQLKRQFKWSVFQTDSIEGTGLFDALRWLSKHSK